MQWILATLVLLALLYYLFHGMDPQRRIYMIHDMTKYVIFAIFLFFFAPLMWSVAGCHTCSDTCTTPCQQSNAAAASTGGHLMNKIQPFEKRHVTNVANVSQWMSQGATQSRYKPVSCVVPSLLLTDLIVATITSLFVFYTFLDPMLHRWMDRSKIETK